jgi:hypothetical protein
MSDVPKAACKAAQNSDVKRWSRSETGISGKPTSRKTDASLEVPGRRPRLRRPF